MLEWPGFHDGFMTDLGRRELATLCMQPPEQPFQIAFFIFATSLRLGFRMKPGHNLGISFACFRFCYLRKIQLQPIENRLAEHLSELRIVCGFNNRKTEIKILLRRKET